MTRRFAAGLVGVGLAFLGGVGCTCCRHRALYDSLACDGPADTPCATTRNDVYTFVLGGTDPFDRGPDRLATGLNEHGFAKVYTGTRLHADWFAKEARRIIEENPDARFAVVGRRYGATRAAELASTLAREGLPVDALVLIDPDGLPTTEFAVETKVLHPGDAVHEAPMVADHLLAVVRHVHLDPLPKVVRPLVDDPAPVPEVVAGPERVLPLSHDQPAKMRLR
jgi:pimeloyl-ACP methyl ester carboxylesterase